MNTENNKLLAEFMGVFDKILSTQNIHSWSDAPFYYTTENSKEKVIENISNYVKYDTDWNWLMEVVEKIEQLRYVTEISGNIERKFTCIAYPNTSEEYISRIGYGEEMFLNKKYVTYQAVVAFIKWYNEQNK